MNGVPSKLQSGTLEPVDRTLRQVAIIENDKVLSAAKKKSTRRKMDEAKKGKYVSSMSVLETQMA